MSPTACPSLMSPEEYRAACEKLGLSPTYGVVKTLGIPARSAGRYHRGETVIPQRIALLLRALVREKERGDDVVAEARFERAT